MSVLLSVNTYDKDAYVDRWVDQCRFLDRSRWRLQVVKNGPSDVEWHADGWETVRCENPAIAPATLGYRAALAAVQISPDVDVIVSVHAKTYLPDLSLLERIADIGHNDIMTLNGWWPFADAGGECLLAFSVRASCWSDLIEALLVIPDGTWNEVAMGQVIKGLGLRHHRLPVNSVLATQDILGYWIHDVDGTGLDLYCCEPSNGNMGFGHYARPGGYRPIVVSTGGVVRDR